MNDDVIKWKHCPRCWPFVRGMAQRPVTRSFDVFFDLRLNKRLSKQSWGWWFQTLSRPLWLTVMIHIVCALLRFGTWGHCAIWNIRPKRIFNANFTKSRLPIIYFAVAQSFSNFAQSTVVALPCWEHVLKMDIWNGCYRQTEFCEIWVGDESL